MVKSKSEPPKTEILISSNQIQKTNVRKEAHLQQRPPPDRGRRQAREGEEPSLRSKTSWESIGLNLLSSITVIYNIVKVCAVGPMLHHHLSICDLLPRPMTHD